MPGVTERSKRVTNQVCQTNKYTHPHTQFAIRQQAELLLSQPDALHDREPYVLAPWHEDFVAARAALQQDLYISQVWGIFPIQNTFFSKKRKKKKKKKRRRRRTEKARPGNYFEIN